MARLTTISDEILSKIEARHVKTWSELDEVINGIGDDLHLTFRQRQVIFIKVMNNEPISMLLTGEMDGPFNKSPYPIREVCGI